METLETKTPEFGGVVDKPTEEKKESKTVAKAAKKDAPQLFDKKNERPSLFESPKANDKEPSFYDLFEQKADKNPPLESLANDEQVLIVDSQTAENLAAANKELVDAEPTTPAEAAAIAGATYNEAVRERIENGEAPTPDMLDGAMNDTAEILGLEPGDIDESDPVPPADAEPTSAEPEDTDETLDDTDDGSVEEKPAEEPTPPVEPDDPEDVVAPVAPVPPVAPPAPPAAPGGPGTPYGPGPPPPPGGPHGPHGPGAPRGPGGPHGPVGPGFAPGMAPPAPWLNPTVAAGLAANRAANHNRGHSHLPYVLLGGVVGYLVGRRRGRINSEKKLVPVQKKLERQVGDLQYQVAAREARIRKLAYEKAISHPQIFIDLPKRLKELQELQQASLKKEDFAKPAEKVAKKSKHNVAKEAAAVVVSSELLNKVAEITERSDVSAESKYATTSSDVSRAERPKLAKDMTTAELLVVAARIPVEDRDLRRLYEAGRITELGVRRIVEVYLRGEQYDTVLYENLRGNNNIESLPPVSESVTAGDALLSEQGDRMPRVHLSHTQALHDPQFTSARREYYETLTDEDSGPESSNTARAIIAIAVGIGLVVALILVFR